MKSAYQAAGVNIEAGTQVVDNIKPLAKSTFRPEVLGNIGGFAGLFALKSKKYKNPVLVSGTDGVGTKLRIAQLAGRHDTIGIDLVAMCVNDLIVTGAEPLFFLDYFATGKLHPEKTVDVIKGIAAGCREAGCALIGGETAEMPSFYPGGDYDLAGFAVGVVEKRRIMDGRKIRPKDLLIGLASSGLHSNAYSLARKIFFEKEGLCVNDRVPELSLPLGETLLTPTRIYVKPLIKLGGKIAMKGAAHITGGGITENLPRILPEGTAALIKLGQWDIPPIFKVLKKMGGISQAEMFSTFNMGLGMIVVISPSDLKPVLAMLKRLKQAAFLIGEITEGNREVSYA
ncbi:MAG: phosphoribosylformylglycinamidine cyclo-ligase [Nitrospiria bacterium]